MKKKNFVIVVVQGGLGNQLFQYAFGKYLENKLNCKVVFDTRYFTKFDKSNEWPEKFRLNFFNINQNQFSDDTSKIHFKYVTRFRYLLGKIYSLRILNIFFNTKIYKIFTDLNTLNYKSLKNKISLNSLYIGHWETKYFADKVLHKLKKDLVQKAKNYKKLNMLVNRINKKKVMLHYSDTSYWSYYEPIGIKFYKDAINLMKKKIGSNIEFHIFSKNLSYSKKMSQKIFYNENFKVILMGKEKLNAHEEFYLMRKYNNFIIPNSTFSWWAAYLSNKKNKLVMIPKKWYYNQLTTKDRIINKTIII